MSLRDQRRDSHSTATHSVLSSDRRGTQNSGGGGNQQQQFVQVNTSSSNPYNQQRPAQRKISQNSGQKKVKHSSHHNPALQGLSPKAAMGVPYLEKGAKGAKRKVIANPGHPEVDEDEDTDPVDNYFHKKRDHRLPALPDFTTPPPVMRPTVRKASLLPMLGEYNPHSYREYKKMMQEAAKTKLGGLGANDSAEAQAARDKRLKMLQYGSSVNAVNFALMDVPEPEGLHGKTVPKNIPRKLTKEAELAEIKRQRAIKYGAQFAHPVHRFKARTPQPDAQLILELKRLEGKHDEDLVEIAKIKAQLHLEER